MGDILALFRSRPVDRLRRSRSRSAIRVSSMGSNPKRPDVSYPSEVLRSSFRTTLPFRNILTVPEEERANDTASVA